MHSYRTQNPQSPNSTRVVAILLPTRSRSRYCTSVFSYHSRASHTHTHIYIYIFIWFRYDGSNYRCTWHAFHQSYDHYAHAGVEPKIGRLVVIWNISHFRDCNCNYHILWCRRELVRQARRYRSYYLSNNTSLRDYRSLLTTGPYHWSQSRFRVEFNLKLILIGKCCVKNAVWYVTDIHMVIFSVISMFHEALLHTWSFKTVKR